jgi:hypothetical protein
MEALRGNERKFDVPEVQNTILVRKYARSERKR